MTIITSQAAAHTAAAATWDALPPLRLPPDLPLTPEQFDLVCAENRDAVLELAADGRVMRMTPVGGETSLRNAALTLQLAQFVSESGGWVAFDSSSGFRLPDGSVLSPDASLVRLERWQALTPEQRRSFAPLCPDLVVELASATDDGPRGLSARRRKMAAYRANGARLGLLLLPEQRAVEVWPASGEPQRIDRPSCWMAAPHSPACSWRSPRSGTPDPDQILVLLLRDSDHRIDQEVGGTGGGREAR